MTAALDCSSAIPSSNRHNGSGRNMPRKYMNTGDECVIANKIANLETTRPKDLPVIHHSVERWLTCMICDGVLERFPNLKIGMIELDHFYTKNYSDFLGVDTA